MKIQPIQILPHPFPIQPAPVEPGPNTGIVPPWLRDPQPITIQPWPLPNIEG